MWDSPSFAFVLEMAVVDLTAVAMLGSLPAAAAADMVLTLDRAEQVEARNVTVKAVTNRGSPALELRRLGGSAPDIDTFAFVPRLDFRDGTIELEVASDRLPDAPPGARGFVGLVFRVQAADGTFACEGVYLPPTNARADQVRRKRSTQYFAYPGYDFDRLRREAPGQYESHVDLVPGDWTRMRVEVRGATAKLLIGETPQPIPLVNGAHGSVGLYVDNGTDGHFRNLRVRVAVT